MDVSVRVSVVIPTYNRRELVCQAVDSVLSQTFSQYEIIIVDDGSTDGTGEAIAAFGDRVRYLWQANQGESVARNRGIEMAQSEYVAFLDSDDLWDRDKLLKQVHVLDREADVVLVGCTAWIMDEQGKRTAAAPFGAVNDASLLTYSAMRERNHFFGGGSSAMTRRKLLDRVGGFLPQIRYGEDWDLWLRLAAIGRVRVIPEPLIWVRRHQNTQSWAVTARSVDRRLADHLTVLDRNPPIDRSGTDPAVARQFLWAAVDDFSIGRSDLGRERLLESVKWDGGKVIRQEGVRFAIDRALALAEPDFAVNEQVLGFFNLVLDGLSQAQALDPGWRSDANARLALAMAAMARGVQNRAAVRGNLWHAFRTDPRSWRRPGFLGGWLESLIGPTLYQAARRVARGRSRAGR